VSSAAAIHASVPEQGRLLTFKRAVVVDTFADLKIGFGSFSGPGRLVARAATDPRMHIGDPGCVCVGGASNSAKR